MSPEIIKALRKRFRDDLSARKTLQRAWHWAQRPEAFWLLALNVYLLSPLLFDLGLSGSDDEAGVDKIVLFAVPVSIMALLAVQLLGKQPWQVHVLLFPFYFLVGTDLYMIWHYDTRLTSSTIAMTLENMGQTFDFVRTEWLTLSVWLAVLVSFYATALYKIRNIRVNASRRLKQLAFAPLVLVYGGLIVHRCIVHGVVRLGVLDVAAHDRGSPFGVLPQSYVAYLVYRDVLEHTEAASTFRFGASRGEAPQGREVYVLVIGESSRPDHWGLYGYSRNTTPRLAREPNIILFEDAVTQAALTSISVPLILTRGTISSDSKQFLAERSIISAYREAGFVTNWLSTQQRDHWTGAVNRYSGEAERQFFYERRHDAVLVRTLKNVLAAHPQDAKHFVAIHTQGSHFVFEDRYPATRAVYPNGGGLTHRERLVNTYDNSILYTDFVLSELIRTLSELKSVAALVYIADHGENLKDDERALFGHYFNNEYDLRIPMLLWHSDEYAALYPEKLSAARKNASQPVSTRNAFYTLAGLAGLRFSDPNLDELNLLSAKWRPIPRHVTKQESWVDFDREFGSMPGRPHLSKQLGARD